MIIFWRPELRHFYRKKRIKLEQIEFFCQLSWRKKRPKLTYKFVKIFLYNFLLGLEIHTKSRGIIMKQKNFRGDWSLRWNVDERESCKRKKKHSAVEKAGSIIQAKNESYETKTPRSYFSTQGSFQSIALGAGAETGTKRVWRKTKDGELQGEFLHDSQRKCWYPRR